MPSKWKWTFCERVDEFLFNPEEFQAQHKITIISLPWFYYHTFSFIFFIDWHAWLEALNSSPNNNNFIRSKIKIWTIFHRLKNPMVMTQFVTIDCLFLAYGVRLAQIYLGWSRMQPIFSIRCMCVCVCCFFYQCCRCVLNVAPVNHLCISQKEIVPRSTRWILPICFAAKSILNWIIMNYWFNFFFLLHNATKNNKLQDTFGLVRNSITILCPNWL